MTNADRIRAMTDEELANYLINIEYETAQRAGINVSHDEVCRIAHECLEWLKQEAEDE